MLQGIPLNDVMMLKLKGLPERPFIHHTID